MKAAVCREFGKPLVIEEISLERWEAPSWIADVLEALYKCLTAGDANADPTRADELFRKMCTLDVTKAMIYQQQPSY